MCRTESYALQLAVDVDRDARTVAVWATAFDTDGQGSLFSDLQMWTVSEASPAVMKKLGGQIVRQWLDSIHRGFSVK